MPVQVVPPMFKMLQEELQWAIEDVRSFRICHLVVYLTKLVSRSWETIERALSLFALPFPFPSVQLFNSIFRRRPKRGTTATIFNEYWRREESWWRKEEEKVSTYVERRGGKDLGLPR
jgi:hypothetical protein